MVFPGAATKNLAIVLTRTDGRSWRSSRAGVWFKNKSPRSVPVDPPRPPPSRTMATGRVDAYPTPAGLMTGTASGSVECWLRLGCVACRRVPRSATAASKNRQCSQAFLRREATHNLKVTSEGCWRCRAGWSGALHATFTFPRLSVFHSSTNPVGDWNPCSVRSGRRLVGRPQATCKPFPDGRPHDASVCREAG